MKRAKLFVRALLVPCALIIVAVAAAPLSAQQLVDVNDPLYIYIDEWERAGYLTMVPDVRPYPRRVLIPLLERVRRVAPPAEVARAERYLAILTGEGALQQASAFTSARAEGPAYRGNTGATLNFAGEYAGLDAIVDFSGYLLDDAYRTSVPAYVNGKLDTFEDQADATIAGRPYLLRQSLRFSNSIGAYRVDGDDFYAQAGIMRSAWGPFPVDNAVLGGQAIHHPSFSWYWAGERLSFSWLYNELTATNFLGDRTFGGKHFMFHNIRWRPFDWIELNFMESVTWGPEWDLRYFLPFHSFFYTQSFSDFGENSMMGAGGTIWLPQSVSLDGTLLVDDASFNDAIRLRLRNSKYKVTAQAGVSWSPLESWLRSLRAEYMLVTPYMYTHQDERENWMDDETIGGGDARDGNFDPNVANYLALLSGSGNFQNYTHFGDNLGPSLLPNSDRLTVSATFSPVPALEVLLRGRMIRHGNASEGEDIDPSIANGDLLDDGYDNDSRQTFVDDTRFLTQSIIERVLQGTIEAALTLPVPGMERSTLAIGAGYTIEHVENPGLVRGEVLNHFWLAGVEYRLTF